MRLTLDDGFVTVTWYEHTIESHVVYPRRVAIYHWLIEELYKELGELLADVELDVIRIGRRLWGVGTYPTIWFTGDYGDYNQFEFEELIEETCYKILNRISLEDLEKAINADGIDWGRVTEEDLFRFYDHS
ncbi:MAG: hypothetical protein AAF846_15735 [Chloroflexota bacterium]